MALDSRAKCSVCGSPVGSGSNKEEKPRWLESAVRSLPGNPKRAARAALLRKYNKQGGRRK